MKLRFHEKFMKTFLHPKEIWKSKVEALVCKIKNVSENISTPCAIAVHQFGMAMIDITRYQAIFNVKK